MQKDFHFYVTYTLAQKAGIKVKDAEVIAWSNQFVDELYPDKIKELPPEDEKIRCIQTQSSNVTDNWDDEQIQFSVLIPFHFIPGNDKKHKWMVTRNSPRAQSIVKHALKTKNPIQLGIALHSFQDTFTHEKFSGWREKLNSCYPWYYLKSSLPNIGHAEMMVTPDIIHIEWTDPRDGKKIDNKERALDAAKKTYEFLQLYSFNSGNAVKWNVIEKELIRIFKLQNYDLRKQQLKNFAGNKNIQFKNVNKRLEKKLKSDFVSAASNHLSKATELFSDLPWLY